jgi:phosphoglycerate dehydrogenase-like enzyme
MKEQHGITGHGESKWTAIVLPSLPMDVIQVIREAFSGVATIVVGDLVNDRQATLEWLARSDVVLGFPYQMDEECFVRCEGRLKLIQLLASGSDEMDVAGAARHGIPVATIGGANAIAVAEHTIMLMLAALKDLLPFANDINNGIWPTSNTFSNRIAELAGKTVGLVGFGNIGRGVARRLTGFDVRLLYYDPLRADRELEERLGVAYTALPDLFDKADIVSLHMPLTKHSVNLVGAEQLRRLGSNGIIVNTSRGGLIDEASLVAALKNGVIRGAALDTLQLEPPVGLSDAVLKAPHCVVTPHSAGSSWESWGRRCAHARENVERLMRGMPLMWLAAGTAQERSALQSAEGDGLPHV